MKYTTEIEIDKPIDEVVALTDDPDNMDKWMEGLQSFEPISGTPGQARNQSGNEIKIERKQIILLIFRGEYYCITVS